MDNNKLNCRIAIMQSFNKLNKSNNINFNYNFKDTKKVISHFSQNIYNSKNFPLWAYSYYQGYFNLAKQEISEVETK